MTFDLRGHLVSSTQEKILKMWPYEKKLVQVQMKTSIPKSGIDILYLYPFRDKRGFFRLITYTLSHSEHTLIQSPQKIGILS